MFICQQNLMGTKILFSHHTRNERFQKEKKSATLITGAICSFQNIICIYIIVILGYKLIHTPKVWARIGFTMHDFIPNGTFIYFCGS